MASFSAANKNSTTTASASTSHSHASLEQNGCLQANVLSVYDLPYPDAIPRAITFSVRGMTVSSGPPVARQKDRNSFRFAPVSDQKTKTKTGTSNSNISSNSIGNDANTNVNANDVASIKLVAPLRELYQETVKVRVTYDDPDKCLETDLDLRQLRIHQQKWLILNLRTTTESKKTTATPNGNGNNSTKTIVKAAATSGSSFAEEDMTPTPTIRIKFKLSGP